MVILCFIYLYPIFNICISFSIHLFFNTLPYIIGIHDHLLYFFETLYKNGIN